jgi:hypothetical protein
MSRKTTTRMVPHLLHCSHAWHTNNLDYALWTCRDPGEQRCMIVCDLMLTMKVKRARRRSTVTWLITSAKYLLEIAYLYVKYLDLFSLWR